MLEYFSLNSGQVSVTHPGIAYGTAKSYMSQACMALTGAQKAVDAAMHGIETEQRGDLIAYMLRRSHTDLTHALDAVDAMYSVLPKRIV